MTNREKFEAWASAPPREWDVTPEPDGKYFMCVQSAWEAWQARCPDGHHPAPIEPDEEMLSHWDGVNKMIARAIWQEMMRKAQARRSTP